MRRKCWQLLFVGALIVLVAACAQADTGQQPTILLLRTTPTPALVIAQQVASPTPTTQPGYHGTPPTNLPASGTGPAPYGPAPALTSLETQLTQQLFNQINQDRATRDLPPYTWNATLEGGARLHSWNMYHCGFSHTCPDGVSQFTRIANEGFAGLALGENIGLAGPSNPPWAHVYSVEESMINEPPGGAHRITLTSTTLHRVGVGIYVAPNGWVWFTEDFAA